MREILLTQGYSTCIDNEDYEWLLEWKWYAKMCGGNKFYAVRNSTVAEGRGRHSIRMHRVVWEAYNSVVLDGYEIDHINGNPLDNRLENLRLATHAQNLASRPKPKCRNSTSQYKGVSWSARRRKWQVHIKIEYRNISLGRFECEEEAAIAYDLAALEYFGEFAWLNFPERGEEYLDILEQEA